MWHKIFEITVSFRENVEAEDGEQAKEKVLNYVMSHPEKLRFFAKSLEGYDDLEEREQDK
jgi:hypothetical protein